MISAYFGKALVALAAAVSITATGFSPAQAAETVPIPVGSTSPCQDVVVIGAKGSGQTLADNKGFGPEAWLGLTTYAGHMDGYKVGYYSVPYAAAPADPISLLTIKYRQTFFESIDNGVLDTLKFLSKRVSHCQEQGKREHYVLMGYSQGAMVMHRVLWQLARSPKYSDLASKLLPRLDGILAIGDGDRAANQGGRSYGTAFARGSGIWWAGLAKSAKYKPVDAPIPDLDGWPASRFHSVCQFADLVCDYTPFALSSLIALNETKKIHLSYGPTGDSAAYVQQAAASVARTSKILNPKGDPNVPAVPVRVGQTGEVFLAPDGMHVVSVEWVSDPIPNSEISPGMPTIPATLTWSPTAAGVVDYTVRVNFTDGTSKNVSGSLQAFPVPAPSLSMANLRTAYSTTPIRTEPYSTVTFDVVKTASSDTTPLKRLFDLEDPASYEYSYVGGDVNGNNILDIDEKWSYQAIIDWNSWEPPTLRTRTVLIYANDTTGAGEWMETFVPVTLTR